MSVVVQYTAIRANPRIIPGPEIYAALHEYTRDFAGAVITEVSDYPPPPPARVKDNGGTYPTYVRTFHLLRSWTLRDESSGFQIQYRIRNPVQDKWGRYYSGYVHGPNQASFHAEHGWHNIKDYREQPAFQAGAQAIIQGRSG